MMRRISLLISVALFTLYAQADAAHGAGTHAAHGAGTHGAHWDYEGVTGPSNWGTLDPEYILCQEGNMQSPINIPTKQVKGMPLDLRFNISVVPNASMLNNGETLRVDGVGANSITYDNITYDLLQFHVHTPSEHKVDGKSSPLEMHYVFADKNKNLLVVGVFVKEGKSNPVLKKMINEIPGVDKRVALKNVNIADGMPKNRDSYQYSGSLTTPPCSQNVQWIVLKQNITATESEIRKIHNAVKNNARPVQELNFREIL